MTQSRLDTDRNILEQITDGYYEVDLDGRFTEVNPAMCALLGHARAEIVGRSYTHFTRDGDGSGCFRNVVPGERFEWKFERGNGERVWVEGSISPIRGTNGKIVGHRGIVRDVTEHKRAARQSARHVDELERARRGSDVLLRLKAEFLNYISRDLRCPMNGIIGMTDLLLETELTPEQRDYVQPLRSSANSLLTLVNDVLDFAKLEVGQLELERIPFHLRDCIRDALRRLAFSAQDKGLELELDVESSVPDLVVGDPTRLRQILVNLVENGIQFTDEGRVSLHVETTDRRAGEVGLLFRVCDTGVGIRDEDQEQIFDSFHRPSERGDGAGLGLAISRQLVQLMGGEIAVAGTDGRGSEFRFTIRFPVESTHAGYLPAHHAELKSLRVLIANGHEKSRQILADGLRYFGLKVDAYPGALSAVHALEAARDSSDPFHVAVFDVLLPDADGFELARRILEDPSYASTRVMLLTRSGQRGDAARCREIGVSGYLSKPIEPLDLLDSIRMIIGQNGESSELVTRHSLREGRRRLEVLVAEDDRVNQLVIRMLLEKAGHRITTVATARAAVDAAARQKFDLMLMDTRLPEVEELELVDVIRRNEAEGGERMSIIAMTGREMPGDRERLLETGVDDYLAKPFEPGALFSIVERFARAGHDGDPSDDAAAPRPIVEPIVDQERLWEQTGGDPALLRQLVQVFLEEKTLLLEGVRRAVDQRDGGELVRAAHRMKSTCATLAARLAAEAAGQLEKIGERGDFGQVGQVFDLLERRMRQVETELVALVRTG